MLVNKTINEYMLALASGLPAPGGGSVAALTGALGAGLLAMVCHLTMGKEEFADREKEVKKVLEESDDLRARLSFLVDEDATAFSDVVVALKLPKDTPQEKEVRNKAIQNGYKKAADVPYRIATTSFELLVLAKKLVTLSNPTVISDVGVAALNAYASVESAIMNVNINLTSIKDGLYKNDKKEKMAKLLKESAELSSEIYQDVNKMLQLV
ncbi:MAG TPA: cyclodeaminase/cyclohydrolase family protein [Syntrophomonadaceae bacterium]|nr:cyclodeaminase/cyclohydrolase family protein [Syntrophomonadaceae bacterium]